MHSSAAVAPGLANSHAPHPPVGQPVLISGPTSPQSSLLATGQSYLLFPSFTLESGITLTNVPIAFKTWGQLDPVNKDNVLVVAHALTGSADVEDWWGPLLGPGKLFDPTRYFIFCANVLGSPYGSAGPCTRKGGEEYDWQTGEYKAREGWKGDGWWGPEFPATTVRDDVRIQKQILDFLGVERIAAIVGGSMGGMSVLEWPILFPVRFPTQEPSRLDPESEDGVTRPKQEPYISCIIPIATAARHGAWCISWAEAQRQSIYADPLFKHGYYSPDAPPRAGLATARMQALLTYRSRDSFESRFGRRTGAALRGGGAAAANNSSTQSSSDGTSGDATGAGKHTRRPSTAQEAALAHNEGNQTPRPAVEEEGSIADSSSNGPGSDSLVKTAVASTKGGSLTGATPVFSAQSYLRYQGNKFVQRFDANCYIHLTRKMDTHDLARGRAHWGFQDTSSLEARLESQRAQEAMQLKQEVDAELSNSTKGDKEVLKGEARIPHAGEEDDIILARVLSLLGSPQDRSNQPTRLGAPPPSVIHVISISSDGLFQTPEQRLIHQLIEGSTFQEVGSPEGHDGFLLEFEAIEKGCLEKVKLVRDGKFYKEERGVGWEKWHKWGMPSTQEEADQTGGEEQTGRRAVKESVFGEVEDADITRW